MSQRVLPCMWGGHPFRSLSPNAMLLSACYPSRQTLKVSCIIVAVQSVRWLNYCCCAVNRGELHYCCSRGILTPPPLWAPGIIDATLLSWLPHGATIINGARGGHIDTAALLKALDGGRIASCLLDVFETEPLPEDDPLWTHPRVRITPHVASVTNIQVRCIALVGVALVGTWLTRCLHVLFFGMLFVCMLFCYLLVSCFFNWFFEFSPDSFRMHLWWNFLCSFRRTIGHQKCPDCSGADCPKPAGGAGAPGGHWAGAGLRCGPAAWILTMQLRILTMQLRMLTMQLRILIVCTKCSSKQINVGVIYFLRIVKRCRMSDCTH